MIEFKSLGPVKIDCDGCHSHIFVSVKDPNDNEVNVKKVVMPEKFKPMAVRIKEMEVYDDDIWVMSFPKCGTTWTQEAVWLLNNDLDYETARKVNLVHRFPFLELSGVLSKVPDGSENAVFDLPRPRHIKSHLNFDMLPYQFWNTKAKIVYVVRNPKDCILSFYHHYRNIVGYRGSLDDFIDCFINAQIIYAPFFDHILSFWEIRHKPNILFLFYEDMKKNLSNELKKIAKFLEKDFTESQFTKLVEHLSVENMRKNPACNNEILVSEARKYNETCNDFGFQFIRKGLVGSYKEEMNEQQINQIEQWTIESLKGSDFKFK